MKAQKDLDKFLDEVLKKEDAQEVQIAAHGGSFFEGAPDDSTLVDRAREFDDVPEPGPDLTLLYAAIRHGGTIPFAFQPYLAALRDHESDSLTSAEQALSDLPLLGPGELESERPYASQPQSAFQRWVRRGAPELLRDMRTPAVNVETVHRLDHIPPGGCARVIPKAQLNGLSRRFDSAYRRLHPDAPSTALSTKYDCVYHYASKRSLSVREYARLQGIPDEFTFPQREAGETSTSGDQLGPCRRHARQRS